ncbi:DUF2817 domain-containing protein [Desulfonema magnum]|nr:DUF2817 domain-containing protein [Desulfonema magnum]
MMRNKIISKMNVVFIFIILLIIFSGCVIKKFKFGDSSVPQSEKNSAQTNASKINKKSFFKSPRIREYKVGMSLENQPIECFVIGEGKDVILILASMHGNEQAGTKLAYRLYSYFRNRKHWKLLRERKVLIMPEINPDGVKHNSRYNAGKVDINRNFPAANRKNGGYNGPKAFSEPETRAIFEVIMKYHPKRIISVRKVLGCIDYDGPGEGLANHMGKYCDLSVQKLGSQPGSFGSYADETLGVPFITFGMPREISEEPEKLWRDYGDALLAAIVYPSYLKGKPPERVKAQTKAEARKSAGKTSEVSGKKSNFENAEAKFQEAVELFKKGWYLSAKKKFEESLRINKNCPKCREYIKNCKDNYSNIHYSRGVSHFKKGKWEKAVEEFEKVRKVDRNYKKISYYINEANRRINEADRRAKKSLDKSQLKKAMALFKEGDYLSAKKKFEALVPDKNCREHIRKCKEASTAVKKGNQHYKNKKYQQALTYYKKVVELNPNDKTSVERIRKCEEEIYKDEHYGKGVSYLANKQPKEAVKEFELVQKADSDYKNVNQKIDEAKKMIDEIRVQEDKANVLAKHLNNGINFFNNKKYGEAIT